MTGILVAYEDLPASARAYIARINARKKPKARIHVHHDCVAYVSGPYADWSRKYLLAVRGDGQVMQVDSGYYESYLNNTPTQHAVMHGGQVPIPPDGMIIEYDTMGGGTPSVHIHVGPANDLAKLANKLTSGDKLNDLDLGVLHIYAGTKGGQYRREALSRRRITPKMAELALASLAEKGLVKINKAGAVTVTVDGHNVRNSSPFNWYDDGVHDRMRAQARERLAKEQAK